MALKRGRNCPGADSHPSLPCSSPLKRSAAATSRTVTSLPLCYLGPLRSASPRQAVRASTTACNHAACTYTCTCTCTRSSGPAAGIAGGGFQQVASPTAAPSRNMELPLAAEPSGSGRRGVMGGQLAVHGAVVEVERRRERSVAALRRSSQGPEPMNGQTGLAE
jgi:hypothetical protein